MNKEELQALKDLIIQGQAYNEYGDLKFKFGMGVELYFNEAYTVKKQEAALAIVQEYVKKYRVHLTHYLPPNGRRQKKLKDEFPAEYAVQYVEEEDFKPTDYKIYQHNPQMGDRLIPTHLISGILDSPIEDERFSSGTMNIIYAEDILDDMANFIENLKAYCQRLQVQQGYCGISPIIDCGSSWLAINHDIFPLIKRFKGLDMTDSSAGPGTDYAVINIRRIKQGLEKKELIIKPLSWLTILADSFVEKLGGIEAIKKQLMGENKLHEWEGGIILQATDIPQLIDVNYGEESKEYNNIARLLKPIRLDELSSPYGFLKVPYGLDEAEESLKWLRRFDEEE